MAQHFKYNNQEISSGDTVRVHQEIIEGSKKRIQVFEGIVIAIKNRGSGKSFTVRKIGANGIGVEKIFPYYSPLISDIKILKHGDVRRTKLYYIRDRVGRSAKFKEKVLTKEQKQAKEQSRSGKSVAE